MSHASLFEVVSGFWPREAALPLSARGLTDRLLKDGGLDAAGLTEGMVLDLLSERPSSNWPLVAFAMSEAVAFYLALGSAMGSAQIATAAFAACVLADGAREGHVDWSFEHVKVLRIAPVLAEHGELSDCVLFMCYVFGKGGRPPLA